MESIKRLAVDMSFEYSPEITEKFNSSKKGFAKPSKKAKMATSASNTFC
ncbi:hypothetical protein BN1195_00437 [Chryseobacterium oranimense G311]|nr:hypothetical protein BN1195_00437 [Chryseobacterium oranimense G311]